MYYVFFSGQQSAVDLCCCFRLLCRFIARKNGLFSGIRDHEGNQISHLDKEGHLQNIQEVKARKCCAKKLRKMEDQFLYRACSMHDGIMNHEES